MELGVADQPSAHLAMPASMAGASPSPRFPVLTAARVVAAAVAEEAEGASTDQLVALLQAAATEKVATAAVHGIAAMTRMAT